MFDTYKVVPRYGLGKRSYNGFLLLIMKPTINEEKKLCHFGFWFAMLHFGIFSQENTNHCRHFKWREFNSGNWFKRCWKAVRAGGGRGWICRNESGWDPDATNGTVLNEAFKPGLLLWLGTPLLNPQKCLLRSAGNTEQVLLCLELEITAPQKSSQWVSLKPQSFFLPSVSPLPVPPIGRCQQEPGKCSLQTPSHKRALSVWALSSGRQKGKKWHVLHYKGLSRSSSEC